MKNTKFDRVVSFVVIGTCLIKAVLYGGSKPPVSTNTPPMKCFSPRPMMSPPAEQTENEPSATYHLHLKLRGTRAARTVTGLASTSPTALRFHTARTSSRR